VEDETNRHEGDTASGPHRRGEASAPGRGPAGASGRPTRSGGWPPRSAARNSGMFSRPTRSMRR